MISGGAQFGFFLGLAILGATFLWRLPALLRYFAADWVYRRDTAVAQVQDEARVADSAQRYAAAYAEYHPRWRSWLYNYHKYESDLADHKAVKEHVVAKAKEAADRFAAVCFNAEKMARLPLNLSEPKHLRSVLREAMKDAAKRHPELGYLRLAQSLPELAHLNGDPRFEAVRDLLPSPPATSGGSLTPPAKPERPTPPGILIFSSSGSSETAEPVPPERVKWS